jgi:transcriptional regulator with XRE-family HTH domain
MKGAAPQTAFFEALDSRRFPLNRTLSTIPVPVEVSPRDVLRCRRCLLVQFRTVSGLCRKCAQPLPLPPRFETAPLSRADAKANGHGAFAGNLERSGMPRGKTARELTIGRKLRELREQRHLTQQEMAGKAGVPRTYISRIENARLLPGPVMLHRIADALAVEILELLPQPKASAVPPVMEGDHFWATLVSHFSQLRPSDMAFVVSHAREMALEEKEFAFAPVMAAP